MCGIAGYVTTAPHAYPESVVERMAEILVHRGPDGHGYYRDEYASLGHRRLSIIDLAGGGQPMTNETGSLWITYNGEIFNHAVVRPPLEAAGHVYHSRCDTETILHALEEYGPGSLAHYRGMFAFAVWDKNKRELFCARDRLGIKPFYYFQDGGVFVLASEIKALFAHPAVAARLDETTLGEYLAFGYLDGERTMFQGIRQLPPGHWLRLRIEDGRLQLEIQRYWDAPHGQVEPLADEAAAIAECRRRLEETVRLRLMSDVPLGMFLSGGVDSSAIAALIRRMASGPVNTFAVGYREAEFSELEYARHVAEHIGTAHHEVVIGPGEFFGALPRLVWHEDEPVTWPSSVSLYFVSQLAAREVKVVLTGEGSDELFGGYGRYRFYVEAQRWMRYYRLAPAALRDGLRRFIATTPLLSASARRKLEHTPLGREDDIRSLYLDSFYSALSEREQQGLFVAPRPSPYDSYMRCFREADGASLLSRLLYADQKTYLVELLRKQDRMSMACSIESRVPFLDHHYVEFAARVPDHLRIRGKEAKYILKRAVEDLLPAEIIYRKKMGFPTPLRQWLAGEWGQAAAALLRDPQGLVAAYTNRAALNDLIGRHQGGRLDATDRLWRLLTLQIWGDMFLTGRRERPWEESAVKLAGAPVLPGSR